MLVGSNPTEGGGFFQRKEPPPGHGCVCMPLGSIIISDGWRAYNNVRNIGEGLYEHQVIIHDENFVDPNDRNVHTQNVENMWMRVKRKLRKQFGTSAALFTSYLHEFIWRNRFRQSNIFGAFLRCLRGQYPLKIYYSFPAKTIYRNNDTDWISYVGNY
jgi:transposase-like protein